MTTDVKLFIQDIQAETGLEISVFDKDGNFIAGKFVFGESVITDFKGIFSDVVLKRTLFQLHYKNENYIGKISGAGKAERNYALLISQLSERAFTKEVNLTKEEFLRSLLFGEASYFQIDKYSKKYAIENKSVATMIIDSDNKKTEDVINVVSGFGSDGEDYIVKIDNNRFVLIKFLSGDATEYHSFTEYARFIYQTVYEETGAQIKICIGGTVKTLSELSISFSQALSACRMTEKDDVKFGVHSFKEYILVNILEDLPKYKITEYLNMLIGSEAEDIFADPEMTDTADCFLNNDLNASETSREMYLHRNTLTYRLDKIERATGLNIRKFSDATTFRLITILSRLVK